ncbi:glycoside hydrolase 5 family protein [Haladaptatus caseinilyticus]|uniref:glycoside hydrolase n=1 Tax=Haladaptatus caseinilyticus TaxID=2993314 RepID=UPI00224B3DA9|nr:glycoside hydrolase [Haladaptatus caseinilyticus]
MSRRVGRRQFLAGIGASAGGFPTIAGSTSTFGTSSPDRHGKKRRTAVNLPPDTDAPVDVRGAIYIPARAFNRYQMWRDYDPAVIERDLGYADSVNLNAIRTWMSYEYWLENPVRHREALEHFLDTADSYGMRVLLGLFDSVGREPTYENLINEDPRTAVQAFSPSTRTMAEKALWDNPRDFIVWFMERYRNDERLLAIELTNEPGWNQKDVRFFREMSKTLTLYQGELPLTVGSTSLANNTDYLDWGMDILQFHYNFARSPELYERVLRQANHIQDKIGAPVWLSEWQRIRPGDSFFAEVSGEAAVPDYASLAPTIQRSGIGNFFWSLMIKPAFSLYLRKHGVLNGLFHEDGAVWDLDDARSIKAMSGKPDYEGEERTEYPDWAEVVKKKKTIAPGDEQPE